MVIYNFKQKTITGETKSLADYRGKVLLIVNTASKCGFTPQYQGLQKLYEKYHAHGFEVLGFPCNQFNNQEPGDESEIQKFCQLKFNVNFPMFAKIDVNGDNAEPLYEYLKEEMPGWLGSKKIKWNFTKFLVDQNGTVIKRFSPITKPEKIDAEIAKLLASS